MKYYIIIDAGEVSIFRDGQAASATFLAMRLCNKLKLEYYVKEYDEEPSAEQLNDWINHENKNRPYKLIDRCHETITTIQKAQA